MTRNSQVWLLFLKMDLIGWSENTKNSQTGQKLEMGFYHYQKWTILKIRKEAQRRKKEKSITSRLKKKI